MIKAAYCNVEDLKLEKGQPLVSPDRKEKISRYRFQKDKQLSCGAYLLLIRLLEREGITDPIFNIGKYGKAYISNYTDTYFNVSHSDKYVACAISDKDVGIDIEHNDQHIDLNIAKNYFFNKEYENIMSSPNPSNEFFNYWVLKESYMKYTGLGFHLKLDSFSIDLSDEITVNRDKTLKFSLFDIEDYKLAVAGKYTVKSCEKIHVNELY
ncbi:MAG: hypothetical protein BZ135_08675 [Methanosphaera sp. rholeuAM6]|nr:MAG: hypothetical protein BZ135_08675 [Methanosphaera sp. rholeuAM6]